MKYHFFRPLSNAHSSILPILTSILLCFICYWPGLTGGFILDDSPNLGKLGDYNGVKNFETFMLFVSNGIAGPTGRPLSLLSFLLNSHTWPADPYPFKLTNLALHCLTGFFLYLLNRLILLSFNLEKNKVALATLITTSFWLLHPFFVSTVLYVVQRMAMLSAFFSIAGLWMYSKGRLLIVDNSLRRVNWKAYLWMSSGLGFGTILAILSKENGILLPLLAACLELCIFSHSKSNVKAINLYWTGIFLLMPSLFVFGYLIHHINPYHFSHAFFNRNFNLPERLLTESRIVTGYIYALLIPKLSYPGLFYDNIVVSKSLLDPLTTLFSTLFITSIFTSSLLLRQRFPFYALAVLFFFTGHLLESTTIPLELYFEHRNYLPAIFLFLPAAYCFINLDNILIKGFIILVLIICPVFTYQLSSLWGNVLTLNLYWAKQNPTSSRAQLTAALVLEKQGNNMRALKLLSRARIDITDSLDLHWYWLKLKCRVQDISPEEFIEIKNYSSNIPFKPHHFNMLQATISTMVNSECIGLNSENALELLDSVLTNRSLALDLGRLFQPHHLKGFVYASTQRPKQALAEYRTVLILTQNVEHGLVQVGILASNGYYPEALEHLNAVDQVLAKHPELASGYLKTRLDYQAEISRIRATLKEEIQSQHNQASK